MKYEEYPGRNSLKNTTPRVDKIMMTQGQKKKVLTVLNCVESNFNSYVVVITEVSFLSRSGIKYFKQQDA
jgi:hypothetical protein